MIKMYGYIPAWGLPDVSPFVSKIDCYLRMVHLPYELVKLPQGDLANTPKGKLPVIEDDGRTISDTVFILDYLKETYGDALDAHLSRSERAVATAFSRMFDESFYWYLVQMRYRRDESFKVYDPIWVTFLDFVPPEERTRPVKEFRERILHEFFWCGKGRHSEEEVEAMARQETQAISDFLGEKPYLMGEQPTTVDASVYSWLTHAMRVPFPGPIRDFGNSLPNLVAYCDRMHDRYYPDIEPFRP